VFEPQFGRTYHVDMNAAKKEYSQSTTLMQKTMTEVRETDFLRSHLLDTSRIISEHAITDNAPPTLGTIAMDFSIDDQLSSLILLFASLYRYQCVDLLQYCLLLLHVAA